MKAFIRFTNNNGRVFEQTHIQIEFAQIFDLPLHCAMEATDYRIPMVMDKPPWMPMLED